MKTKAILSLVALMLVACAGKETAKTETAVTGEAAAVQEKTEAQAAPKTAVEKPKASSKKGKK